MGLPQRPPSMWDPRPISGTHTIPILQGIFIGVGLGSNMGGSESHYWGSLEFPLNRIFFQFLPYVFLTRGTSQRVSSWTWRAHDALNSVSFLTPWPIVRWSMGGLLQSMTAIRNFVILTSGSITNIVTHTHTHQTYIYIEFTPIGEHLLGRSSMKQYRSVEKSIATTSSAFFCSTILESWPWSLESTNIYRPKRLYLISHDYTPPSF